MLLLVIIKLFVSCLRTGCGTDARRFFGSVRIHKTSSQAKLMSDNPMIGYIGGFTLGICVLPQLYKAISTKSTDDISFGWQCLYIIGMSLMTIYGFGLNDPALYVPFAFELFTIILLTICKIKFDCFDNRKHKTKKAHNIKQNEDDTDEEESDHSDDNTLIPMQNETETN